MLLVFTSTFVIAILVVSVAGYIYEPYEMKSIPPEEIVDYHDTELKVHFIDVGIGNAVLISYQNKNMLIDAGVDELGTNIIPYMYTHDITRLDYMIPSSHDQENINGMIGILTTMLVQKYMDNGHVLDTQSYESLYHMIDVTSTNNTILTRDDTIDFHPDIEITVLNPEELTGNFAKDSIVIKLTYEDISFLFMGEAGFEVENELIKNDYDLDVTFLKIGQYGSKYSSSDTFLDYVNPSYCIIQEGPHEDYVSPHTETMNRLKQADTGILDNKF
ncbi:MBL fold metallo-hydrolase, partial [Methanosalsum natronophilum]